MSEFFFYSLLVLIAVCEALYEFIAIECLCCNRAVYSPRGQNPRKARPRSSQVRRSAGRVRQRGLQLAVSAQHYHRRKHSRSVRGRPYFRGSQGEVVHSVNSNQMRIFNVAKITGVNYKVHRSEVGMWIVTAKCL